MKKVLTLLISFIFLFGFSVYADENEKELDVAKTFILKTLQAQLSQCAEKVASLGNSQFADKAKSLNAITELERAVAICEKKLEELTKMKTIVLIPPTPVNSAPCNIRNYNCISEEADTRRYLVHLVPRIQKQLFLKHGILTLWAGDIYDLRELFDVENKIFQDLYQNSKIIVDLTKSYNKSFAIVSLYGLKDLGELLDPIAKTKITFSDPTEKILEIEEKRKEEVSEIVDFIMAHINK